MTPNVIEILREARKEIHAATAERACVTDTHALLVLDHLITADAGRAVASANQEEVVAGLNEDTSNPYIDAEIDALRKSLAKAQAEAERQREQDDKLIRGLQAELRKRGQA